MVGDVGNAPATSAMSMLRSTSELIALNDYPILTQKTKYNIHSKMNLASLID